VVGLVDCEVEGEDDFEVSRDLCVEQFTTASPSHLNGITLPYISQAWSWHHAALRPVSVLLGSSAEADNGVASSMLITAQEQRQIPTHIFMVILHNAYRVLYLTTIS
jgi:hypothetical protein